jgi:hypothetical protein
MKAFSAGYPGVIGPAVFRDGDWAVQVRGVWFYYAEARLLPAELRHRALEFDPQPFYLYLEELPPWKEPGPEDSTRIRLAAQRRKEHPPKRSQHFHDALWQASTRDEAYDRVKSMRFLNHNLLIHYSIMEELSLVEARILQDAKTDAQVREWIRGIGSLSAWNYRTIADTQSRSFHAYGAAVDVQPTSQRGLETYWLWTSERISQWWNVPYSRRIHPPNKVIKAFEAYGFIWGGKWNFYDTMHFEYRPEILILNNMFPSRY